MKTIIFDIDGTITNMWPIEKMILLSLLGNKNKGPIESLKKVGVLDTYKIFCIISKQKINKRVFFSLYKKATISLIRNSKLPLIESYPIVKWIISNKDRYNFVYATGGQEEESIFALKSLGIYRCFDLENSISKSSCCFSKKTGIPFRKIKLIFEDSFLVTDSENDCEGARKIDLPFTLVKPKQKITDFVLNKKSIKIK